MHTTTKQPKKKRTKASAAEGLKATKSRSMSQQTDIGTCAKVKVRTNKSRSCSETANTHIHIYTSAHAMSHDRKQLFTNWTANLYYTR